MAQHNDIRAELARLQKIIQDQLGLAFDNLMFEYTQADGNIRLDLITVNPRHNQSFLFHTTYGVDRVDALERMAAYVKSAHADESTYTVQWATKGGKEMHTSYFRSRNIYEALDKLYYGRDMNMMTVYLVKLNPLS